MMSDEFFERLHERIAKYDLLEHPFYKAWSAGELTNDDLHEYAKDYYHHVQAFPSYLAELAVRLDDCELRRALLANLADEKGLPAGGEERATQRSTAHSELWLDFVEGTGRTRAIKSHVPDPAIKQLTDFFHSIATDGTPDEALTAFYVYESQVPAIATEKVRGLRDRYGKDEKTYGYFTLHATADIFHANVWRNQLRARINSGEANAEKALSAGENSAKALWQALDGIEARRTQSLSAA